MSGHLYSMNIHLFALHLYYLKGLYVDQEAMVKRHKDRRLHLERYDNRGSVRFLDCRIRRLIHGHNVIIRDDISRYVMSPWYHSIIVVSRFKNINFTWVLCLVEGIYWQNSIIPGIEGEINNINPKTQYICDNLWNNIPIV